MSKEVGVMHTLLVFIVIVIVIVDAYRIPSILVVLELELILLKGG